MSDDEILGLVIVGANLRGLSLAIEARSSGLDGVVVLDAGEHMRVPDVVAHHGLDVRYRTPVRRIEQSADGTVTVETDRERFHTRRCAVAVTPTGEPVLPDYELPTSLAGRFHRDWESLDALAGQDVLVIGPSERAVDDARELAARRANVVLAFPRSKRDLLSMLSREQVLHLETDRLVTILWESQPDGIDDADGHPMVIFDDRRTPDLQFDHVVVAQGRSVADDPLAGMGIDLDTSEGTGSVVLLHDSSDVLLDLPAGLPLLEPATAWETLRTEVFTDLPPAAPSLVRRIYAADADPGELSTQHYNAVIAQFEKAHSDLWLLRVEPDSGDASHLPGQYATLGLGHWEPRLDDATDITKPEQRTKLIRRSYSISSRMFDEYGYLSDPWEETALEFYIVLVPATPERISALTPRLALKNVGDRLYLGPKITGRYTLAPVVDPHRTVVFLGTGTGEAPHNAMVTALLRKGHQGRIVSAVSVRYKADLGYLYKHRLLEERYAAYTYLPLTTREPENVGNKIYIQDLIGDGHLEEVLGGPLDPETTDVFLCGNPAMIGLPSWDGDVPTWPDTPGVTRLLVERGFVLDRRGVQGNVHYEEYW